MFTSNIFKSAILALIVAFLANGCSTTYPVQGPRTQAPPQTDQQKKQAAAKPQTQEQEPQKTPEETRDSAKISIFKRSRSSQKKGIEVKQADIDYVRFRLQEYEDKYGEWLEISEFNQDEQLLAHGSDCLQRVEKIISGYNLLLERMLQSDTVPYDKISTVDPRKMQQLDIAFLESRCSKLLTMDFPQQYELVPETVVDLSFNEAQEIIVSHAAQGNYREVVSAYDRLSLKFPDQKPLLSTQLLYGFALQYSGQIGAAAEHFNTLLAAGDFPVDPLSLRRIIADLLFASGNIAAAENHYNSIIGAYDSLGAEKIWAEEQLAFLRSVGHGSEEMAAYMKFMREFHMYDYKIHAPELNKAIDTFAADYAGSPAADRVLQLKKFADGRLQSWFNSELAKIDYLVAKQNHPDAADNLKNLTRYYLPADMQAVVQKTYYDVSRPDSRQDETLQEIRDIELTLQWEAAVKLLDSEQYDFAITAFEALLDTEYKEQAEMKIVEAANQAAGQMRKEAASLFIRAGKTQDHDQKKELLLASHRLLNEIPERYPQTDLLEKVKQNIDVLEVQIYRFDPSLLEER
ncbi:MAG: hypothetical protein R3297_03325 [Desulfobulbales bacterium]|nr:hypothetical protein [Desulfobulbales bacterium]